jgi:hypothetical protein
MNKKIGKKELILIGILAVVALGAAYYFLFFSPLQSQIASYSTTQLEQEIEQEKVKAEEKARMLETIAKLEDTDRGELATYNNLYNEISTVGDIFGGKSENITVKWSTPTLTGSTVRRDASISFNTTNYNYLKRILSEFNKCKYRCIIKNLSIRDTSPKGGSSNKTKSYKSVIKNLEEGTSGKGIKNGTKMDVSFLATFYETSDGAKNLEGLIIKDKKNDDGEPGKLESRAHAYDNA